MTQNPRWGSTFYLPLPCYKHLLTPIDTLAAGDDVNSSWLLHMNEESEEPGHMQQYNDDELLLKRIEICKGLLNWWGEGYIKIAVVDGERFNEEIFLGEVGKVKNKV